MAWYDLNWQYRRAITIDNTSNSSNLTNYQVKIDLDNTNFDFTKANSDGSDVRFTDSDGSTLIDFWIESWDSTGQTATLWVEVPSIAGSSTATIYLYYGNSSASSASNGDNTFLFFDDFNDNSFDTSKWNIILGDSVNVEEVGQTLHIKSTTTVDMTIQSNTFSQNRPFIVEYKVQPESAGGSGWVVGLMLTGASHSSEYRLFYYNTKGYNLTIDGSLASSYKDGTSDMFLGTWYDIMVVFTSSDIEVYRDGTLKASWTNSTYTNLKVGIGRENGLAVYFDDFRVRQYTSPEPSTSVGSEEIAPILETLETLSLSDSVIASRGTFINVLDTFSSSEAVNQIVGLIRQVSDKIGLTDTLKSTSNYFSSVKDTLNLSEIVKASISFTKSIADSIKLTEAVKSVAIFSSAVKDKLNLSEMVKTSAVFTKSVVDSIGLTETIKASISFTKSIADSIGFTDAIEKVIVFGAKVSDKLTLVDTMTKKGWTFLKKKTTSWTFKTKNRG